MQQIKIKYRKGEQVKYISHRDLMRAVQRAIRRAELPIAYSQGFNPHMKISWGNALKVGATSEGEFATLQLDGWMNPEKLIPLLNAKLPAGLEVIDAAVV
ncbi:MAG: TIGR03936 family radical SAM-associated protein [bacterium]